MAFRVVSIEHPAELHVNSGQLLVEQGERVLSIPLDDMIMLVTSGPNIRMSTMAQTMLAGANVIILNLGRNHLPSALTIPTVANARLRESVQLAVLAKGRKRPIVEVAKLAADSLYLAIHQGDPNLLALPSTLPLETIDLVAS